MEITREKQLEVIEQETARQGLAIYALEKKSGLRTGAITDFIRGKTTVFRADKWQKILIALGLEKKRTAPVIGTISFINIGGEVTPYDQDFPLYDPGATLGSKSITKMKPKDSTGTAMTNQKYRQVAIPDGVPDLPDIVALQIENDPTLPDWLDKHDVGYSRVRDPEISKMFDQNCICKIKGGPVVMRRVRKGRSYGNNDDRYDLVSIGTSKILEDRELEWCAKILFYLPPGV